MAHHHHGGPFATIVARGAYIELQGHAPRRCVAGHSLIVHGGPEEHADYFLDDVLCVNVELPWACASQVVSIDGVLGQATTRVLESYFRNPTRLGDCVRGLQALLAERLLPNRISPPAWLQEVLVNFAWCDAVPLQSAAKDVGIHPVQFSRAFRAHTGMSPSQFRLRSRLERASAMLLTNRSPLARVANECGFADQSHLTRTFNEALGLSPKRFQRVFAR